MAKASVSTRASTLQAQEKPTHREQQLGRRNLLGALDAPQAEITHPDNPKLSDYQHRRRDLLGRIAGLPVAAAVTVPASAAEAEDPHIEWERQCSSLLAEMRAIPRGEGSEYDALWDQWIGLQDRICLTPASTPAGIAAQVRRAVITTAEGSSLSDQEDEGLRNAVRSLTRMAGLTDDGLGAEEPAEPQRTAAPFVDEPDPIWREWRDFATSYQPKTAATGQLERLLGRLPICSLASMSLLMKIIGRLEGGQQLVAMLPEALRTEGEECLDHCCERA